MFITTSGNTVRPNVAPLRFMLEEATYLEGMLAASMSKTGKAGVVGGMEIPSVKSTIIAFEAGAKAVSPDFQVVTAYVGNWDDVGAAKEAALALIQQGADFLFHNADAAGLGVFQAAQEKQVLRLRRQQEPERRRPRRGARQRRDRHPARPSCRSRAQVKDGTFVGQDREAWA